MSNTEPFNYDFNSKGSRDIPKDPFAKQDKKDSTTASSKESSIHKAFDPKEVVTRKKPDDQLWQKLRSRTESGRFPSRAPSEPKQPRRGFIGELRRGTPGLKRDLKRDIESLKPGRVKIPTKGEKIELGPMEIPPLIKNADSSYTIPKEWGDVSRRSDENRRKIMAAANKMKRLADALSRADKYKYGNLIRSHKENHSFLLKCLR